MARPIKVGLDYFPLDVSIDDDVELLEAECGLEGFAILIKLWQKIYKNSYYIEWNIDNEMLFARKINSESTKVNSVINACLRRDLFNKEVFEKYSILTSSGIQKRYIKACSDSKRKNIPMIKEYILVNSEFTGLITELTSVKSELTLIESSFSTQSKVKKSREEKSTSIVCEMDEIWRAYPLKKGKVDAYKKLPAILKKYSTEELLRCITRYDATVKDKNYYLHGSTFFNGKYVDYLDANYTDNNNNSKSELSEADSEKLRRFRLEQQ